MPASAHDNFVAGLDEDTRADYEEAVETVADFHRDGLVTIDVGSETEARRWVQGRKRAMVSAESINTSQSIDEIAENIYRNHR
jgi:hypothetical protein